MIPCHSVFPELLNWLWYITWGMLLPKEYSLNNQHVLDWEMPLSVSDLMLRAQVVKPTRVSGLNSRNPSLPILMPSSEFFVKVKFFGN